LSAIHRHFTLEEANRTLPLVRRIVADIESAYRTILDRRDRLELARHEPGISTVGERATLADLRAELESETRRLVEFVEELERLGCLMKGPTQGLVDFPALLDGRTIYLCWKKGEERISHWHEVDGGFANRREVDPIVHRLGAAPAPRGRTQASPR
jgi:hypothetical protein